MLLNNELGSIFVLGYIRPVLGGDTQAVELVFVDAVTLLGERRVLVEEVGCGLACQFKQLPVGCEGSNMQVKRQSGLLRTLQIEIGRASCRERV